MEQQLNMQKVEQTLGKLLMANMQLETALYLAQERIKELENPEVLDKTASPTSENAG